MILQGRSTLYKDRRPPNPQFGGPLLLAPSEDDDSEYAPHSIRRMVRPHTSRYVRQEPAAGVLPDWATTIASATPLASTAPQAAARSPRTDSVSGALRPAAGSCFPALAMPSVSTIASLGGYPDPPLVQENRSWGILRVGFFGTERAWDPMALPAAVLAPHSRSRRSFLRVVSADFSVGCLRIVCSFCVERAVG